MTEEQPHPRVLVVDGDDNVLRLLHVKLSRAGFDVRTWQSDDRELAAAFSPSPDLLVLGDGLSELDGHLLLAQLAGLPSATRPAVVFLSAQDDESAIERALRGGGDDYVVKPFSPEELVHRLRVTLVRRRLAGTR